MYHMFFSASILFLILIFVIIYFHCWFLEKSSRRRWLSAVLSQLLSQHRTSDCLTIKKNAIIKLSNTVCELECQSFYFGYFSCTKKNATNCDVFSTIYISVRFLDSKTHFFHTLQLPLQQLFHFQALHK